MSDSKKPKKKKSGLLSSISPIWLASILVAVIAAVGALQIFGAAGQTTTYYVLNKDVPARTQITPEHLSPVVTAIGGEPPNAFTPADVAQTAVFSQMPLIAGDIVSSSNAGELDRISENLPENFVVASFNVPAEDAVAGKIRKGDFIDVAATYEASTGGMAGGTVSKIVLHRVLVLDVTVQPSSISEAAVAGPAGEVLEPGPESELVRSGIPATYTVAVSPADFTKLAALKDMPLYVALSSNNYVEEVNVQSYLGTIFAPDPVTDSAKGTEETRGLPAPVSGDPITEGDTPPETAPVEPTQDETVPDETVPEETQPEDSDGDGEGDDAEPTDPDGTGEQDETDIEENQ